MPPLKRLIQTLLYLALVIGGITLGNFSLFALAPGDPAEIILRERHETPGREQVEHLRRKLALVIAGLRGAAMQSLVIGIAAAGWPWRARLGRACACRPGKRISYWPDGLAVYMAFSFCAVIFFHQLKGPVLAAASLKIGRIILAFSGLSYLGLGPPPPAPEWGSMLQEAGLYMTEAPWMMAAPGAAITLTVLALNLPGEGPEENLTS